MPDGDVWVISADRDVGKSLRRRRVRARWWVWLGVDVFPGFLGVRERDHASFGRKRGVEDDVAEDKEEDC